MPVYVEMWGANNKYCRPRLKIVPHSGVGGWAPSPRNPNPAAHKMAEPTCNVDWTIIGARQLGKMWRKIILPSPAPAAFAAWTNSVSLRDRAEPLTIRA